LGDKTSNKKFIDERLILKKIKDKDSLEIFQNILK
jgi:hypothetical protein